MHVIERFIQAQVRWRTEHGRLPVRVTVSPATAREAVTDSKENGYDVRPFLRDGIEPRLFAGGCDWYEGDVPDGEFRFE
jgi:hypothetical protein